jgi:uncharacterized protein
VPGAVVTAKAMPPWRLDADRFQVLALDGGGLKGLFLAAVLGHLEADLGVRITDHFDLIAGTSTGGIIAVGLAIGMRPWEIVEFYSMHGPHIFPQAERPKWVRRMRGPRYGPGPLRAALHDVFGARVLADAEKRLVIPSYDIDANTVHLFRTPHSPRLNRDFRVPMVDVALATSAAPTFLPAHRLEGANLVDGGVWANNPTMVAVTEAGGELGLPLRCVRVLSLGTTSEVRPMDDALANGGLISWARRGPGLALDAQALTANNQAAHLLGRDHVLRIDPVVAAAEFRLDLAHDRKLLSRAANASRHASPDVRAKFLDHVAAPYTPFRTSADVKPRA